jgi:signal transduction histidine kinase
LTAREHNLLLDLSQIVVDEMELRIALKASMTAAANEIDERNLQNDFISSVTHELRTPLTSIQGSLRLIDAGALGEIPAPLKSALGIASRNSDTLLRLINDLLDFQKLGAGRMEFKFQTVSSENLLRTTCENIAGLAARKNVLIDIIAEQDATFLGDNERLAQVLANILSNAVKYSPDGAHITATTWHDTRLVHFSITDRGSGIPPEFQDKMFQKFARARGQSSTSGTGLGLAISKVIVEAHGGTIGFDSSSGGTTFKVALPLRQSLADSSGASG